MKEKKEKEKGENAKVVKKREKAEGLMKKRRMRKGRSKK